MQPADGDKLDRVPVLRNGALAKVMQGHWDSLFQAKPDRFGSEPSFSAKCAAQALVRFDVPEPHVLDLGSGTGRDAHFFAQLGMRVVALDFSQVALDTLERSAKLFASAHPIKTVQHDVREPLPFSDSSFDACYSHMLYCMDFTLDELATLCAEVRRVLKPGGIHVYTARTTEDPDFGIGTHRGEQIYEDEGFAVHFFGSSGIRVGRQQVKTPTME